MTHGHAPDTPDFLSQEFRDERYRWITAVWSGNPNPRLVEQVADVTSVGRANVPVIALAPNR